MTRITDLLRPHLLSLKPYASARHEFQGDASIFLDANENPFDTGFNRYPDPLQFELKEKIASWRGVMSANIFLGNGSDEAIDLLIRLFCCPGIDQILTTDPSYGMYTVSSQINNIHLKKVALNKEFQLNVPRLLSEVSEKSKLLFLCSPNNPSGNCLHKDDVIQLVKSFPGIVVIDEAYIDFCPRNSLLPLIDSHSNVAVLQTFSKAWGLAGIRLGMAFSNPELIGWMNKIKPPYNVNTLTQQKALEAFKHQHQTEWIRSILEQRKKLSEQLMTLNCVKKVYPSDANFILTRFDDAKLRYTQLTNQGIVVRDRSNVLLCDECLRISVGTPAENNALIQALRNISK